MSRVTIRTGSRIPDPGPRTSSAAQTSRVAIVHDWLTGMRGGEKFLEALCELYPDATIHTLVRVPGSVSQTIETRRIKTSLVQRFPAVARLYRHYLPFFPTVVELIDLDEYDVVISSSHCAVKSIVRSGSAVHVCYCHSPMRYAWDQFDAYFGPEQVGRLKSGVLRRVMAGLARWDAGTAGRVDVFLANSQYVARRIRRYYNRGSTVVYPPIDTEFYRPRPSGGAAQPTPRFLVVSALVPYKRVDVAIEACRIAGVPLTVVGRGPEQARLERMAGPACDFLGWRTDEEIRDLYQRATAVLLPGIEDFGLVPVEAQACGCPVVALGAGGACETVIDGVTGILVRESSPQAFAEGLAQVQRRTFDAEQIRANALRFSRERFMSAFTRAVDAACADATGPLQGHASHRYTAAGREDAASDSQGQSRQNRPSHRYTAAGREDAASDSQDQSRQNKPSHRYTTAGREDAASDSQDQSRQNEPSHRYKAADREDQQ